jgi:hypothetical protein
MANDKNEKTGISAAVDHLLSADDPEPIGWSGQQLSLIPSDALASGSDEDKKRQDVQKRGRGRPPGAENKKTMEWMKYINSKYTNPLIFLAECYNRPAAELAKQLGCTTEKAFGFQMAAATKMTEFTNQKMPTTVELGADGDLALTIQTSWVDPNAGPSAAPGDAAEDQGMVIINAPVTNSAENLGDQTQDVVLDQDESSD